MIYHHLLFQVQHPHPQEPIYHTLDPGGGAATASAGAGLVTADGQQFDTLGRLDVMLPNGQFVPATLVRQKGGHGGVVGCPWSSGRSGRPPVTQRRSSGGGVGGASAAAGRRAHSTEGLAPKAASHASVGRDGPPAADAPPLASR